MHADRAPHTAHGTMGTRTQKRLNGAGAKPQAPRQVCSGTRRVARPRVRQMPQILYGRRATKAGQAGAPPRPGEARGRGNEMRFLAWCT